MIGRRSSPTCRDCGKPKGPTWRRWMKARCPKCFKVVNAERQRRYQARVAADEIREAPSLNRLATGFSGRPCGGCGDPTNNGFCTNCGIYNGVRRTAA